MKTETVNDHFFNDKDGNDFLQMLMKHASSDAPVANTMLVLRTLTNAFKQPTGRTLMLASRDYIVAAMMTCKDSTNKNVQVAMASVLLNYAVAFNQSFDVEGKSQCLSMVTEVIDAVQDAEARFRLLVCLGTLMVNDDNSVAIASSLGLSPTVGKLRAVTEPSKVGDCARLVYNTMNNLQNVDVTFR